MLVFALMAAAPACSTSRKVVIHDGYRGMPPAPSGFEPRRAPTSTLLPDPSPPLSGATTRVDTVEVQP